MRARARVPEWILARVPHLARARVRLVPIHSVGARERGVEDAGTRRVRGYVGTRMFSIGLRIKERSSHMAPKREPLHLPFALIPLPLPFSFPSSPLGSSLYVPSFSLSLLSLSLSLSVCLLSHPQTPLAPSPLPRYSLPPRTLQFSNGFVLADYVSLLPISTSDVARCACACVRAPGCSYDIIRRPRISPLSGGTRVSEAVIPLQRGR